MQKFSAYFAALMFLASLVLPQAAFAACQDIQNVNVSTYTNPVSDALGVCNIPDLLLALVHLVLLIGVPVIVVFIIYSGFLFVSAGDNESRVGKAKMVFTWTVVGALVLLGAEAIALAIQGTVESLGSPP